MDLSLPYDIVENITLEEFNSKYLHQQKPVVIKGLVDKTEAKHWTLESFKSKFGNHLVDVVDNSNAKHKKTAVKADFKMKFADFINKIQKDEECPYRIFLLNIFKEFPELRNEFPSPKIVNDSFIGDVGYSFFGGKNTQVKMHYDIDMSNVFHTHFEGKKRCVLFSQESNDFLYRLPFSLFSPVDMENPDYDKYPALMHAKGYDIHLEAGDTLFMPAGFWHYMTYLTGGFSISYRSMAPTLAGKLKGLKNLLLMVPFDRMMLNLGKDTWYNWKHKKALEYANASLQKGQQLSA